MATLNSIEAARLFWARLGDRVYVVTPDVNCPKDAVAVRTERVGALKLPTGRLTACDPANGSSPEDCPPFDVRFEPGDWPVEVYSMACRSKGSDGTHLAAAVRVGESPVARWELAATRRYGIRLSGASTDPVSDRSGVIPIDGGQAAFVDQAAVISLGDAWKEWASNYDPDSPFGQRKSALELPSEPEANAILFRTGVGDGAYPCFVGFSAADVPIVLLMLFDTFDAARVAEAAGVV